MSLTRKLSALFNKGRRAKSEPDIKVLMVCMGNICRSPMAEGVFRHHVTEAGLQKRIYIESAGTHAYHNGEPADPRSVDTAERNKVDISMVRARILEEEDFQYFDYIIAMDASNLRHIRRRVPAKNKAHISRFMDYAVERAEHDVPDPYYGGPSGFDRIFEMIDVASAGFLAVVKDRLADQDQQNLSAGAQSV